MKASWFTLTTDQQRELEVCVRPGEWRVVPRVELPSVFPESFRVKVDSALVIAAPTSTGGTYLAYSANRIDYRARAVDIEPLGLIVHSTGASSSAVFLHHGTWPNRTDYPPSSVWNELAASSIGDYFLTHPPNGVSEGTLDQLPKGHRGAFDAVIAEIRRHVGTEDSDTRSNAMSCPPNREVT
jgi:hypothetical protein